MCVFLCLYLYIKSGYEWATCYDTANFLTICAGHPKYLILDYFLIRLCLFASSMILSCLQFLIMDKRIGIPYASDSSIPPKKKFKPLYSLSQEHGRIVKNSDSGKTFEFIYNNFSNNENIHTAIVGDSIFDNICIDNCVTFSLSAGKIDDFFFLFDTLKPYPNIILAVGGNNLSNRNGGPGEQPPDVLRNIRELYEGIKTLQHSPRVIVCTVLKRLNCEHFNIQSFNAMLTNSNLPYFKLHQEVFKPKGFMPDGVHLNEKGRRDMASAVNKLMIEKGLH